MKFPNIPEPSIRIGYLVFATALLVIIWRLIVIMYNLGD